MQNFIFSISVSKLCVTNTHTDDFFFLFRYLSAIQTQLCILWKFWQLFLGIFSLQAVEGPQDLEAFWISVNTECSGIDFQGLLVADGQATVLLKNNGESTGDIEVGRGGAGKSSNHWLLPEANLTHAFSDILRSSGCLLCIFVYCEYFVLVFT